jgi:serine/threonine-protein kinase
MSGARVSHEDSAEFIRLQTTLTGRYSLEREVGRGGMGIVYLAHDVALDRPVALKVLPPALAADATLRERFLREARTAARLSHPNIVPIFAVEEILDVVFFAMPFIEGETLGQRVRMRGPMPPSEAARILREVSWALAYAHAQGVIHRDVKPDNILLEHGSHRALIADFGIARVTRSEGMTVSGAVVGTPEFMSPEQASGEVVDGRSDIYALGIVAFFALSGRLPFEGSSVGAVLAQQITQPAPPIADVTAGLPGQIARVVDRCLAKDPAHRFPKAEDLADALAAAADARRNLPVSARIFTKRTAEATSIALGLGVFGSLYAILAVTSGVMGERDMLALDLLAVAITPVFQLIPAATLLFRARELVRAGYRHGDMHLIWKRAIESEQEERLVERGRGPSRLERIIRWLLPLGLIGLVFPIVQPISPTAMVFLALGSGVSSIAAIVALRLHDERTNLSGRLMSKFWTGRLGKWMLKAAGLFLKSSAAGAATHRPTELAIGTAVDALFEALPKPARQQLSELPAMVRRLEGEAAAMRTRIASLDAGAARVEPEGSPTSTHLSPEKVTARRAAVDEEFRTAVDVAKRRLADAVTALEGIRLDLLRLTIGTGSIETLTADLAAARDIGDEITRLLAGRRDVDRALDSRMPSPP